MIKIGATSLIVAAAILLASFFVPKFIFDQIQKESDNLIFQRSRLTEAEAAIKNIQDFRDNFKRYQPDLEKIDRLFADSAEPIKFIEFLEQEAALADLSIEIAPPAKIAKGDDFWPSLLFNLKLEGSYHDFMRFLERLESGLYLSEVTNLNVRENLKPKTGVTASLSVKAYTK